VSAGSAVPVASELGDTTACNVISYLLDVERPINAWHHLASDDTHMLLDGGPVEYLTVEADGVDARAGTDRAAGAAGAARVAHG